MQTVSGIRVPLGRSTIEVSPFCLGGNVFGREGRTDEKASVEILDRYVEAGGNFIDTADVYSGGRSEEIIGSWMAERGNRAAVVIATKVGMNGGLSDDSIERGLAGSLARLHTDVVDLYYAHRDDPSVELAGVLAHFDRLVREGRIREYGLSNYSVGRLEEAHAIIEKEGFHPFAALQPEYNLMERIEFETGPQKFCEEHGVAVCPYFSLAKGFLTGKYANGATVDSTRADSARAYLTPRGEDVLRALAVVASAHGATSAQVALAWLRSQTAVTAPIASARTRDQLEELLPWLGIELSAEEVRKLDRASSQAS